MRLTGNPQLTTTDVMWVQGCPSRYGKREIAALFEHYIPRTKNGLSFVHPRKMPNLRHSNAGGSQYFVQFQSPIDAATLKAVLDGREEFISGLSSIDLFPRKQIAEKLNPTSARETITTQPQIADPITNPTPLNSFDVLDVEEKALSPSGIEQQDSEDGNGAQDHEGVPVGLAKQKKKKPKKGKEAVVEALVEKTVDRIESPAVSAAPSNQCAAPRCTAKTGIMGMLCQFCNRKFCMAHRHPEAHSERCTALARGSARATQKSDATLIIELGKREPGAGARVNSAAKEREDAKRRLKDKIAGAGAGRASSSKDGAGKAKKK
ncbi:hypothetical protein HKX48_001805 [Thoreauomyces humboldtii]|nr:hypothetical protein HKX48_001805 [Thoreauomyces humboldtii]